MAVTFKQATGEGPLLLADISGYTSFLQDVATAHRDDAFADGAVPEAYRMMSSLLDGIVTSLVPPFTLSKLEGDAVFAFARIGPDVPRGATALDPIRACYAAFRSRLEQVGDLWTCTCAACSRANALDLKFILHAGRFVEQARHHPIRLWDIAVRERIVPVRDRHVLEEGGVPADIGKE